MTARLAFLALLLASWLAAAGQSALGGPPYTLTHDVRVRIDVRLQLMGFGGERPAHRALLEAAQDTELSFSHAFAVGERSFDVALSLTPSVDLLDETCRIEIAAELEPPSSPPNRVSQMLSVAPERVRLVELWSGTRMEERLVLAFTATWETIPRVRVLRPGAEPLAIVLEVLEGERVLQRHELAAVVGEPSAFMVRHGSRENPGTSETPGGVSASLEFLPKALEDGRVDLSVTLVVESDDPEGPPGEPFRVDLREKLAPGFSLVLPLPTEAGGGPGTRIHVTPWF